MAAAWAWSYGPMSKRLKRNFLFSTEYNLMFNKILKENMWLKARKKSLLRISCLFKVFPWRPKTLRMFFLNEPLICLVCKDPWRLKSLRLLLSEKADVQRTVQNQPFSILLLPPVQTWSQERVPGAVRPLGVLCRDPTMQIHLICAPALWRKRKMGSF